MEKGLPLGEFWGWGSHLDLQEREIKTERRTKSSKAKKGKKLHPERTPIRKATLRREDCTSPLKKGSSVHKTISERSTLGTASANTGRSDAHKGGKGGKLDQKGIPERRDASNALTRANPQLRKASNPMGPELRVKASISPRAERGNFGG